MVFIVHTQHVVVLRGFAESVLSINLCCFPYMEVVAEAMVM